MTAPRPSELASVAATVAAAVPGVVRLDPGPLGTQATYGAGSRVDGVTVRSGQGPVAVTVHVAVGLGTVIPELAGRVHAAVTAALNAAYPDGRCLVTVSVTDVVAGEELPAAGARRRVE